MNLLTVARRANLGAHVVKDKTFACERLACARTYVDSVATGIQLVPQQLQFHYSTCLVGIVSIAEAYMQDATQEFIVCHPGHIANKALDLNQLVANGSVLYTICDAAERTVRDLAYQAFPKLAKACIRMFNTKAELDERLLDRVNEIKCTRDLIVHNSGRVNAIYLHKTGSSARAGLGETIPLTYDYVRGASTALEQFVEEFFRLGPARYADRGKTRAFREMWEATSLQNLVSFDSAWIVEGENMVRPKKVDWAWSSSEKALYDFFLGIYSSNNPERTTDVIEALRLWPPPYRESRVITSWLESPFSF
jgi:hypothetical protein